MLIMTQTSYSQSFRDNCSGVCLGFLTNFLIHPVVLRNFSTTVSYLRSLGIRLLLHQTMPGHVMPIFKLKVMIMVDVRLVLDNMAHRSFLDLYVDAKLQCECDM